MYIYYIFGFLRTNLRTQGRNAKTTTTIEKEEDEEEVEGEKRPFVVKNIVDSYSDLVQQMFMIFMTVHANHILLLIDLVSIKYILLCVNYPQRL